MMDEFLQVSIQELERKVKNLEKCVKELSDRDVRPVVTCPECGILLRDERGLPALLSYSCPQRHCPTGLGGVW